MANPNFRELSRSVAIGLAVAGGTLSALTGRETPIAHAQQIPPGCGTELYGLKREQLDIAPRVTYLGSVNRCVATQMAYNPEQDPDRLTVITPPRRSFHSDFNITFGNAAFGIFLLAALGFGIFLHKRDH